MDTPLLIRDVPMVNYYDVLKVKHNASSAEIKSAYRRLARKLHPDVNQGSEETALQFARIAEAYEILGSRTERVLYDKKLDQALHGSSSNGDSVFDSTNPHAKRWRQMVLDKRFNEIIDRMLAEERRESTAMQRAVYPTVALFFSTLLVLIFKPAIFGDSAVIGKIIVISLFIAGIIHIVGQIRDGYEYYTYDDEDLHESILDENEPRIKPYSRWGATFFLVAGFLLSFCLGLFIGSYVDFSFATASSMFSHELKPELIFYPPIIVLFVDLMHYLASRFEA
ncbi:MAG: J domain-containing protein [Candidatus Binatia bacterium]